MIEHIVILAGGLGTRLNPFTVTMPKALIPIAKKPFIFHQLDLLKKNHIKQVHICIAHHGEQLKKVISEHKYSDLQIHFHDEGKTLLGTAGAIRAAFHALPDSFFILYGDSYLPCDFQSVANTFFKSQKKALMTVYKNKNVGDKSNVIFDGKTILTYDKKQLHPEMHYIDYGLGVFQRAAFQLIPENQRYDLATFYQQLLSQNELAAHEVMQRFYEVGSWQGVNDLERYIGV